MFIKVLRDRNSASRKAWGGEDGGGEQTTEEEKGVKKRKNIKSTQVQATRTRQHGHLRLSICSTVQQGQGLKPTLCPILLFNRYPNDRGLLCLCHEWRLSFVF